MKLTVEQEALFFQAFTYETRQLGSVEAKCELALRLAIMDEPLRKVRIRQIIERYLTDHEEAIGKMEGNFASQKEAAIAHRDKLISVLSTLPKD